MDRRLFLQNTSLAGMGMLTSKLSMGKPTLNGDFPVVRKLESQRHFKSVAVENLIKEIQNKIGNKELGWLFGNCFPNTLDTTVDYELIDGNPDTYVITGDIDAMWLRDSTAQVSAYLPLCREDEALHRLINGVIRRQVKFILEDPYANAFYKDPNKTGRWKDDYTEMKPGIHERKWELDSICYPIRLSYLYWKETGDLSVFDSQWQLAMRKIVQTFREQQRLDGPGPYHFQRLTKEAVGTLPMSGYGYPARPNGMIRSMFRPSDDATLCPYLIPSNLFAVVSLNQLAEIGENIGFDPEMMVSVRKMAKTVWNAVQSYGTVKHPQFGKIYAYECNGYGSVILMDDPNVPSLLSLPYLGAVKWNDPVYLNTRRFVLSKENPFYYAGSEADGQGSPHTGVNKVWPIGIIMRGLTSTEEAEIARCLKQLVASNAGTGFIHESFNVNNPSQFTRKWFAWANTLFGELVWKIYREKNALLNL